MLVANRLCHFDLYNFASAFVSSAAFHLHLENMLFTVPVHDCVHDGAPSILRPPMGLRKCGLILQVVLN